MLRLMHRRLRKSRRIDYRLPIRQPRLIVAEREALGDLPVGRERGADRVVVRPADPNRLDDQRAAAVGPI